MIKFLDQNYKISFKVIDEYCKEAYMITLNKIRELVLSQEQELEKLIFEYFLQKDITN